MFSKVLEVIKTLAIVVFLSTLTYEVIDLSQFVKQTITETQKETFREINSLRSDTKEQINDIRTDTFLFLNGTTDKLNTRISSVQKDIFLRIDENSNKIDGHLTVALTQVNNHLNKVDSLVDVYAALPDRVNNQFQEKFGEQTDCQTNELCWQNMTTDLLVDTRNVVRDGSKTFRTVDASIPKLLTDANTVSNTVADNLPPMAKSIQLTADHIQKITTPHWYDRVLSYGISGGLLYFTAKK
jgi:hypothetical protein